MLKIKHLRLALAFLITVHWAVVSAQDPDSQADEEAKIEEIFRSSEQEKQVPTSRRQRDKTVRRVTAPKGSFRVGCQCMDDTYSDVRSIGACSGHGGVRFWVYRIPEGDTVHIRTGNHERHPHALDAAEMSALSQKRADRVQKMRQGNPMPAPYSAQPSPVVVMPDSDGFDWPDATALATAGVVLFFIIRLVLSWVKENETLVRYALRNLLRHKRRPPSRPRGENPRKKRLP